MLLAAALGALVGFVLALTGAGGAIIAVPLLVFGFDLNVAQAAPIALLAVAGSAMLGALLGLRAGIVRYRAAILMSAVGSLFTPLANSKRTAAASSGMPCARALAQAGWAQAGWATRRRPHRGAAIAAGVCSGGRSGGHPDDPQLAHLSVRLQ